MSRAPWVTHFGLTRMPFSKSIAAPDLYPRAAHAEAVARIGFCIAESLLGVIVGDVGSGKTVAVRAAVAGLDRTRHQVIYVANPTFGTRGLYVTIVTALGGSPRYQRIGIRFTLAPMDLAESLSYLRHHLALVGRTDPLFADDAVARLHRVANGLPRDLNNAATAAMIAAAADGKALVDDASAKKAAAELTRE